MARYSITEGLFHLIKKIIAILYCGIIILLSHQKQLPTISVSIHFIDKFYHFVEFSLCAGLVYCAWSYKKNYILFLLIIFAASDEIHQYFIPGRSSSIFDFIADLVGILMVYIIFSVKDKKKSLLL